MTLVKICGIRELEHARASAEAGADLLGFVFVPVRRQIAPELAALIVTTIRSEFSTPPAMVGLFVNETANSINRIASEVQLDLVQLSGDESPDLARKMARPAIKAVRVRDVRSLDAARATVRAHLESSAAVLIDSHVPGHWGGTGVVGDWTVAAQLSQEFPVILAGGLNAGNVIEAVRTVKPAVVDVSSGVETDGRKDCDKIHSFIHAARKPESLASARGAPFSDLVNDIRMRHRTCSGNTPTLECQNHVARSSP